MTTTWSRGETPATAAIGDNIESVRPAHWPCAICTCRHKNEKQDIKLSLDDLLPAGEARDGVYQISLTSIEPQCRCDPFGPMNRTMTAVDNYSYRYGGVSTTGHAFRHRPQRQAMAARRQWSGPHRFESAKPLAGCALAALLRQKPTTRREHLPGADGIAKIIPLRRWPGRETRPSDCRADCPECESNADKPQDTGGEASKASHRAHLGNNPVAATPDLARFSRQRHCLWRFRHRWTALLAAGFEAFVYTDRGVYRPGETVYLRAIVRGHEQ